jgi:hopanoid biosynthesis associated protein HpnK
VTRRLVVTGDDFGMSAGVNSAIAQAHDDGVLTSTSVMVTGDALDEAVELARARPELSTGLHLVFCDARAASPPDTIPDLVDGEGRLPPTPGPTGVAHALWWRRRRGQIEREIRAQFERYLETGLPFDHVDGHHHMHMHPMIFDIVVRCMEDYKVPWVRLVDEDPQVARSSRDSLFGEFIAWAFGALARRGRRVLTRGEGRGPDQVAGLRASGRMDRAEWLRLLGRLDADTVEVYTHPDTSTDIGRRELDALCAPEIRDAVARAGYSLVGTRQAGQGGASEHR